MRKVGRLVVVLGLVVSLMGAGGLVWQRRQLSSLNQQQHNLQQAADGLQARLAALRATDTVNTATWKRACDPQAKLCFKYPAIWKLQGMTADKWGNVSGSVTNPAGTATVAYRAPLVKDGSYGSAHIVSLTTEQVAGTKLSIVGLYPVASGMYEPQLVVVNSGAITGPVGQVGFDIINPRFDIGAYHAVSLTGSYTGQTLPSEAAAQAWLQSVDGKTVAAILASYGPQA